MKKLFGEANINVENFNEAERKQKIKGCIIFMYI